MLILIFRLSQMITYGIKGTCSTLNPSIFFIQIVYKKNSSNSSLFKGRSILYNSQDHWASLILIFYVILGCQRDALTLISRVLTRLLSVVSWFWTSPVGCRLLRRCSTLATLVSRLLGAYTQTHRQLNIHVDFNFYCPQT